LAWPGPFNELGRCNDPASPEFRHAQAEPLRDGCTMVFILTASFCCFCAALMASGGEFTSLEDFAEDWYP